MATIQAVAFSVASDVRGEEGDQFRRDLLETDFLKR